MGLAQFAKALQGARKDKRLSQRDLSEKLGMPQSHLSKIESGAVDLRTSSLIDLARALDLDVVLVPRRSLAAVEAITGANMHGGYWTSAVDDASPAIGKTRNELERFEREAHRVSRAIGEAPELDRLRDVLHGLIHMPLNERQAARIRAVLAGLTPPSAAAKEWADIAAPQQSADGVRSDAITRWLRDAQRASDSLREIRNAIAHGAGPPARSVPAYRLSDDGGDDA